MGNTSYRVSEADGASASESSLGLDMAVSTVARNHPEKRFALYAPQSQAIGRVHRRLRGDCATMRQGTLIESPASVWRRHLSEGQNRETVGLHERGCGCQLLCCELVVCQDDSRCPTEDAALSDRQLACTVRHGVDVGVDVVALAVLGTGMATRLDRN